MARIIYFSPDFPQPSGGIKTLYRHVTRLVEMGFDAWIVHQKHAFRATWHGYEAPTLWLSERPRFTPEDVLVIPEVMHQVMQQTASFSGERVVIALSWSPTYWNLPAGQTWASFGIRRVMTKSPVIQEYVRWCMGLEATLISEYVTPERYYYEQATKRPKICYLTRKDRSAAWLQQVLQAKGAPFTGFEWMPLRELSEDEYARHLREATVYVTTNMQEGMNSSVLEAMACGCLVVGFSGIGGGAFMRPEGPGQTAFSSKTAVYLPSAESLKLFCESWRPSLGCSRESQRTVLRPREPIRTRRTRPTVCERCFPRLFQPPVRRLPPTPRPEGAC